MADNFKPEVLICFFGNAVAFVAGLGVTSVSNGGTGSSSLTTNGVLLGNSTSALKTVSPGTSGNVLTSDGTIWVSTTPSVTTGKSLALAIVLGS